MENDKSASDIDCLHDAIRRYLQSNPNAADSLDGIMNWWLPNLGYEKVDTENLFQALEQLTAEGVVRKVSLMDGTILYRFGGTRN